MSSPALIGRRVVWSLLAGAMLLGALPQSLMHAQSQNADRVNVLITFARVPGAAEQGLVRSAGGQVRHAYRLVPGIAASLPSQAVAALANNPNVLAIEPDVRVEAYDAELDLAWGVARIGSGAIHASGVTGAGVRVAVFDSGLEYTHFELAHAFAGGWDFVNGDDDPSDDNGHGTHVSGTIAAADDDQWVVGVAPNVQLVGIKILDATGQGDFSDVIAGLQWAVDHGVQVANHSYGSSSDPGTLVAQAFANSAAAGLLHVAAAGNTGNCRGTGNNIGYPARYDSVIAVGSTDSLDNRSCFSSTGPALELAAPGEPIASSYLNDDIAYGQGTSMASPHVAGAAALLMSAGITNAATVRNLLTSTAIDLGNAGRDNLFGFGLVNVPAALAAAGTVSPAVYVALSTDQTRYVETDTTAVLTVSVSDETGAPLSGLGASLVATFDGAPALLTFLESQTPGTYTGTLDISTAGAGQHAVSVEVTSNGLTGGDVSAFLIGAAPVAGTVHVPSITYAAGGGGRGGKRNVTITVTTVDGSGAPVANAVVAVLVYVDGAAWAYAEGATDAQGHVTFGSSNAPSGAYYTQIWAVSAGGLVWDGVTPPNGFVK
jgi:subtilisin family serine protease